MFFVSYKFEDAVTGFGTYARWSPLSPEMSFSVRQPATSHPQESRQQSTDADELVVHPAVVCKRDSGVVVCPW